jgi:hypothetical protein
MSASNRRMRLSPRFWLALQAPSDPTERALGRGVPSMAGDAADVAFPGSRSAKTGCDEDVFCASVWT